MKFLPVFLLAFLIGCTSPERKQAEIWRVNVSAVMQKKAELEKLQRDYHGRRENYPDARAGLKKISLAGCPPDFQNAFQKFLASKQGNPIELIGGLAAGGVGFFGAVGHQINREIAAEKELQRVASLYLTGSGLAGK